MKQTEQQWDKLLKIKTSGRDDTKSDCFRYPYEPTPYAVLERLANSGFVRKQDVVLDYGCGKGRVDFFLTYQTRAHCIGVEYDERIIAVARENQNTAVSAGRVEILLGNAETFPVPEHVNRIFFFNPFSVEILQKAMARILESYYETSREMLLFFYFPSPEYISYLMTVDELSFYDEIDCSDLFEENKDREKIVIFQLGEE